MAFLETMAKLIERYNSFFTEGIVNTLIIAAFSVLFGAILGTLMASLRMCRIPPLRWIAVAYIEFVRGTPLMVQLMFIFYGLPMIGITIPNIPWIPNFSRFAAGIVAMSMNSCAYVAEITVPVFRLWTADRWRPPGALASAAARPCGWWSSLKLSAIFSRRWATNSSPSSRNPPLSP